MLENKGDYGKVIYLVCGLFFVIGMIVGCGKKAPLDPPVGEYSTFPRSYPQYAIGDDGEEEIRDFEWPYIEEDDEEPVLGDIG